MLKFCAPDIGATNLSLSHASGSTSPPSKAATEQSSTQKPKQDKTPLNDSRVGKRSLNTLAARRYRQRRTDETQNLENELKETQAERDDLKLRVARLEGELDGLKKRLLSGGSGIQD